MYKYLIIILLLLSAAAFPQVNEPSEFNVAVSYFNKAQYDSALTQFSTIASDTNNEYRSAAMFFKGKTLFKLNKNKEALNTLNDFEQRYSQSRYIDEVRMLKANYFTEIYQYISAYEQLCIVLKNSSSREYVKAAKNSGRKLSAGYLNSDALETFMKEYKGTNAASFVILCYALKESSSGRTQKADSLADIIIKSYPLSDEYADALKIKAIKPSNNKVIAALLPLTINGKKDETANEILEGIKFAVDEYNTKASEKTGLLIKDTRRDSLSIDSISASLPLQKDVKAILGPVYSSETNYLLEKFEGTGLPVLSPTATDNELTEKFPNFIQANSSFVTRGIIMANYIYYVENKRKMAVLAANSGYSSQLANAFKTEFLRLGGKIISDQTYRSGSFNLSGQVNRIEEKIKDIQGIYVPLNNKADAAAILSQLGKNKIDINLYGNQDWYKAKGFESATDLSSKLLFCSDYFIDYNDAAYIEFNNSFRAKTGSQANRNVLYGYDAAKYLLETISEAGESGDVLNIIKSGITSKGFHNYLSFDEKRKNKYLNIIRYRDGVFELVDRFKVENNK